MTLEKEYFETLNTKLILKAANDLQIEEKEFLNPKMAELYSEHDWMVIHNPEVGIVINAVPDIYNTHIIPWEEWFIMDNELHHYVLFSVKHEKSTMTWQGELDDKDHPKQVLGRLWHAHNDKITPFLNQ